MRKFRLGRKRKYHRVHEDVNADAVKQAASNRPPHHESQLPARHAIDGRCRERDEEVQCSTTPRAAVLAPPLKDFIPSKPLAIAWGISIGFTPCKRYATIAYPRSSAPTISPPHRIAGTAPCVFFGLSMEFACTAVSSKIISRRGAASEMQNLSHLNCNFRTTRGAERSCRVAFIHRNLDVPTRPDDSKRLARRPQ